MKIQKTPIHGLLIIEDEPRSDSRGSFTEIFTTRSFIGADLEFDVKQVNASKSLKAGTVRGMHWQAYPKGQTKLVRCIAGEVLDVIVDVRSHSETYGQNYGVVLAPGDGKSLYIPRGLAHGWQALKDNSEIVYIVAGAAWDQPSERGVSPLDPKLKIAWLIAPPAVCERDASWPSFGKLKERDNGDRD
jgi:dTDP-4-dehydrorhamnose 3,5-epimerase